MLVRRGHVGLAGPALSGPEESGHRRVQPGQGVRTCGRSPWRPTCLGPGDLTAPGQAMRKGGAAEGQQRRPAGHAFACKGGSWQGCESGCAYLVELGGSEGTGPAHAKQRKRRCLRVSVEREGPTAQMDDVCILVHGKGGGVLVKEVRSVGREAGCEARATRPERGESNPSSTAYIRSPRVAFAAISKAIDVWNVVSTKTRRGESCALYKWKKS